MSTLRHFALAAIVIVAALGTRESLAVDASGLLQQLGLKPRQQQVDAAHPAQATERDAGTVTDDATAMRRLEQSYRGMRVRPTPFPGIYDLSKPGQEDLAPMLVDADNRVSANNGVMGWHDARTGAPLPQNAIDALHASAVAHLPWHDAILMGGKDKPVRVAVLSAVECIPCRKFEKDMKAAGIPYYVFPSSLFEENRPIVASIWCQVDRARAWGQAMGDHVFPRSTPAGCQYPDREVRVLRAYFSYVTPTLIYADGTTSAYRGMATLRERMTALERTNAMFDAN
ncbi:MAG: thioredoxin fold domain-containing protein [Dokdonella sp.]|uniref:thioredoxin fold domain-containing protein n=1 Tax=Dokdonella sp. TaxID=2291710 RepID=UPI0025BDC33E|nr:thioredoxin fold domain-containing protein [Dokdonella sp.]MBX3701293.1 thioredoxin fold domain-containing protein [Dokdonella sp.]